mmetsp:Transcript_22935/g.28915  ORF Transcript_22935/g.28915 Transcript_22935/m.28915 type:complete len:164 (-) Transcript_22935:180-671(-)
MQHLKLLGGKTPEELWPLTNACIPGLLLLLLAPKWTHTKTLSLIGPIFMAFIYTLSILSVMIYPEVDPDPAANFTSLEGVMALFKDETGVFIGWVHYIVFDPLVARWIVLDSITEKKFALVTHLVVVVPCFILTILFGPMGFLLYMMLRSFLPPSSLNKVKSG